ncbi:MAG: hypothetical protein ABI402_13260 [Ferruginibacter sp.]
MNRFLIKCCLAASFLILHVCLQAQEFKNDAGEKEKHFINQVKQIDEFFERFNDDSNSFVREVYKSYKTKFKIDRKTLIKSLFNYEGKSWNNVLMDSFIKKAMFVKMPTGKNWYGENWFAEANCKFQYNSSVIEIPVILRIMTDEKKRSKWVIIGIKPSPLKERENSRVPIIVRKMKTKFIDPSSHGTNFIELERDFNDKDNLSDYFDSTFFYRQNALPFYHSLINHKIKLVSVKDIKYHFLNVDDYIFTVEYFPRQTLNSGWLISDLKQSTAKQKDIYKRLLLGEQ